MEIAETKYLLQKINQLNAKRAKHQRIIDQLINSQQSTNQPVSSSRTSQFKPITYNQSDTSRSNATTLSRQVNLDVYLAEQTQQQFQQESADVNTKGLVQSLESIYGNQAVYVIEPNRSVIGSSLMVSEDVIDFQIVAQYLQDNGLWEEVFVKQNQSYFAYVWSEFDPHHRQMINLSNQVLSLKETQLLVQVEEEDPQSQTDSELSKSTNRNKTVCVAYLLLYRLLCHLRTGEAPKILQSLFGYPFSSFNIGVTEEYLQYIQVLQSKNELIILGVSALNNRRVVLSGEELEQMSPKQIIKSYKKLYVCHVLQHISSKSISVVQRRNHHSVVDIQNQGNSQIEVYFSILNKNQQSGSNFRYCFVNQQNEILKFSQNHQVDRETIAIKFAPNSQYKLYISKISQKTDPDLSSFSIIFSSISPIDKLTTQIKFNESYNTMTQILINKYLGSLANIDEVQKQMIRLSQINPQADVLIVRTNLRFMGLATDFVSVKDQARKNCSFLYAEYQDEQVLCDKSYRDKKKKINIIQRSIYQVHLSKKSKMKAWTNLNMGYSQIWM